MDTRLVEHLRSLQEENLFTAPSEEDVNTREAEAERKREERRVKVMEMFNSIRWNELEAWLSTLLKTPITLKVTLTESYKGTKFIKWQSNENLVSQSGVMQAALKDIRVGSFNSSDLADLAEKNFFWSTVNLSYEAITGGTNGLDIGRVWFNFEDSKWVLESEIERMAKVNGIR